MLSQYLLDRFSRSFRQMEDICVNFLDHVQFFRFLMGRCHGNQFRGKNGAKLPTPCTYRSVIRIYHYLNECINSVNDASKSCYNFIKFGPVTSELTWLICESQVRHGHKTGTFSRISLDIRDQFSQSFHHIQALYVQMMDLYLIFQFFGGRCHGNQIIFWKCFQRRLIPLAFVALLLENDLAVRVNSGDDGATSSKNLVNFCLVTLEMTGLICERQLRHGQQTGVFCRISRDILEVFSQYFHHMKALYVQMMDLYLIFQFIKGRCHGNQIMLP